MSTQPTRKDLEAALARLETSFDTAVADPNNKFRENVVKEVRNVYKIMRKVDEKYQPGKRLSYYLSVVLTARETSTPVDWEQASKVDEVIGSAGKQAERDRTPSKPVRHRTKKKICLR